MSVDDSDRVDGAAVEPTLDVLVQRLRRVIELDLRVCMPARVVTFDAATCKATVRLELLRVQEIRGEAVPDIPTIIPLVPVVLPRNAIAGVTIPILPGDTGRVVFSDRALAAWLQNGNPVAPVDPENGRAHNLADAMFEPGVFTDADAIAAGPIDMTATVVEHPALVKLGALAVPTDFVAIAPMLHAYLTAMITAAPVAALDGGAAFKAALLTYLGANPFTGPTGYAATKVVAE